MPTIAIANVFVADQAKALAFYTNALTRDAIPAAQFRVHDVHAEYARLSDLGVRFTQQPLTQGPVTTAVLDDTCGNLVQIAGPSAS